MPVEPKYFPASGSCFAPVQPLIDRAIGGRLIRQTHLVPQPCRSVTGIDRLKHYLAIFSRDQWGFEASDRTGEMVHFLRKAIIPQLLKDRPTPSLGRRRLFDRVAEAVLA